MVVFLAVVLVVTLLFIFNYRKHSYWEAKGVPVPSYLPFFGHVLQLSIGLRWIKVEKVGKLTEREASVGHPTAHCGDTACGAQCAHY